MSAEHLLDDLRARGIILTVEQGMLRYRAPAGALSDELRQHLRENKTELLALLTTKPAVPANRPAPMGQVGRHGAPCPQCGDTWQWPTTRGWTCGRCLCMKSETIQGQPEPTPATGRLSCPGCSATTLDHQAGRITCTACRAYWLPSIDLATDAPQATIRRQAPDGSTLLIGIYRCPKCQECRWGPRLDNPDVWHCLACAGLDAPAASAPDTDTKATCPQCGAADPWLVQRRYQCRQCPHVWHPREES